MAEVKKNTANNAEVKEAKKVTVRLPRLPGQNANQDEFFSVNGRNYIIKRGETVEVPLEVAELIENNEQAEEYALNYVSELDRAKDAKEKELGLK